MEDKQAISDVEEHKAISVVEAALLCADAPMAKSALQKLFEPQEVNVAQIDAWLTTIQTTWQDRGLELVEISTGWRFQSRVGMQRYLEKLNPERTPKYSRAVLETLAIIAWKQPVTRADIEAIRGVTVSSQIVKTLEERGWVETLGHRDGPGRPALLGTTKQFLNDLGLRALDELPPLQPLTTENPEIAGLPEDLLPMPAELPDAQGQIETNGTLDQPLTEQAVSEPEPEMSQSEPERQVPNQESTDSSETPLRVQSNKLASEPDSHPTPHEQTFDQDSDTPEQK